MVLSIPGVARRDHPHPNPLPQAGEGEGAGDLSFPLSRVRERVGVRAAARRDPPFLRDRPPRPRRRKPSNAHAVSSASAPNKAPPCPHLGW